MSTHSAWVIPSKGAPMTLQSRPTPTPGPSEVVIQTHALAFNIVDVYQRDFGFPPFSTPAVLGSDCSGIAHSVGSEVTGLKPGDRVAAFASGFYKKGVPDYGAFQEMVLVPAGQVSLLPEKYGFAEGAMLGMAVWVAQSAWYSIGLDANTKHTPEDKQGMLVWGAASGMGAAAVQVAKMMGFTVYATASEQHHEYIKSLGASKVFDYKTDGAVESIIKAIKEDGVTVSIAFDAVVGTVQQCIDVLLACKGEGTVGRIASAPVVDENTPKAEGIEIKFILPPMDEKERDEWATKSFNQWLPGKLQSGEYVPSPHPNVLPGGLEGVNEALDVLKKGVSGQKLIVDF